MKKLLFIVSVLFLNVITIDVIALGKILTPTEKREYNKIKVQLHNHIMCMPIDKRSDNKIGERYLKKIGTPIALRLLDNLKKMDKLSEEGNRLILANKHRAAATKFTDAILIDEDFEYFWEKRGSCYFSLKNYPQSLHDYSRAISLNPSCGFYYTCRALCHQVQGNNIAAMNDILIAASLGEVEAQNILKTIKAVSNKKAQEANVTAKKKMQKKLEERFGFKSGTVNW